MSRPSVTHRLERLLAASRLFSGLGPALLAELARATHLKSGRRGDRVFRSGDDARHFHLIHSGLVKVQGRAADGTEAIVGLFGPRESVGDAAVVGRGVHPVSALVASPAAELIVVDRTPVLAAMEVDPAVSRAMVRALVEHTHALHLKIGVMSAGAVPKRLATLLLCLADRFGDEEEDGTTFIPVAVSRIELAAMIGARVETTTRAIRAWEKAGLVETSAAGFRLRDPARLATYAREGTACDRAPDSSTRATDPHACCSTGLAPLPRSVYAA